MITASSILRLSSVAGLALLTACSAPVTTDINTRGYQPLETTALARSLTSQMNAEIPNEIYFGFDQDDLDRTSTQQLDEYAAWMIEHPAARFSVIDHADKVGSNDYNQNLGWRRAERVVAYLISKGVSYAQLQTAISVGEDNPRIATEARERLNRRVTIEVIEMLPRPVVYRQTADGRPIAVAPRTYTNTRSNVRRGFIRICAQADLLSMLTLESNTSISQALKLQSGTTVGLDLTNPDASLSGTVESAVGDVGATVGTTVEKVGKTVGGTVEATTSGLGGLLGG